MERNVPVCSRGYVFSCVDFNFIANCAHTRACYRFALSLSYSLSYKPNQRKSPIGDRQNKQSTLPLIVFDIFLYNSRISVATSYAAISRGYMSQRIKNIARILFKAVSLLCLTLWNASMPLKMPSAKIIAIPNGRTNVHNRASRSERKKGEPSVLAGKT